MNILDILWLAYKGLMARKALTVISVMAIVIAISSVTYIIAFTTGFGYEITSLYSQLNPTNIYVTPTTQPFIPESDVVLMETLPGIKAVYPVIVCPGVVDVNGKIIEVTVVGVNNISATLGKVELESGSFYPPAGPYAVIGSGVANASSYIHFVPGSVIVVRLPNGNSVSLTVEGVLKPTETIEGSTNYMIFIPLSEAQSLFGTSGYSLVVVRADSPSTISSVEQLLTYVFGGSLQATSIQQILSQAQLTVESVSVFLFIITSVSLVVGAFGILGITLARVYQRIREIGIMKTLGLTKRDVLLVFLFESIMVGLAGGVLGLALTSAITASKGYTITVGGTTMTIKYMLSPEDVAITIIVALVTSIVAGIYPAWKASRMTVIDAIRRE